jgi:hypothetical protein
VEAEAMTEPTRDELLDALEDMVRQHATEHERWEPNTINSGELSADADAMRLLARAGRMVLKVDHGRMVVGVWVEPPR